jgi:hypothetical protein
MSYESCKLALAILSPKILGVVDHVVGAGIQGDDPSTYRVVVYVEKGRRAALPGDAVPDVVHVNTPSGVVAVPVTIEEQDTLRL